MIVHGHSGGTRGGRESTLNEDNTSDATRFMLNVHLGLSELLRLCVPSRFWGIAGTNSARLPQKRCPGVAWIQIQGCKSLCDTIL